MTDARHIVHVLGTLGGGGVQRLVLGLAATAALRVYRHSVMCVFEAEGELQDQFRTAGIPVQQCRFAWPDRLPLPSYRLARWIRHRLAVTFPWRMAARLRECRADLVHTHVTNQIHRQATAVLRQAKRPWIWTLHGLYEPPPRKLAQWRRAVVLARRGASCITAVSHRVAEDFVERGLGAASEISVVHSGTDIEHFRAKVPRDPDWRRHWKIPLDAILFGSSGRLVTEKAYEVFAQAAAALVQRGVNAHFAIAGEGRLREALETEIARLDLHPRFHLVGFQADLRAFLNQLDVFVMPSRREGFGMALVEALAAGLPCVATRVGGMLDILGEDGGLLVPPDSPEPLAEAMTTMLSAEARHTYAQRAPAKARPFSYDHCAAAYAEIYERLLEG